MGVRHVPGTEKLVAYVGAFEYTPEIMVPETYPPERDPRGKGNWEPGKTYAFNVRTELFVSEDQGETWEPAGRIDKCFPNLRPFATSSGRLIIPGQMAYYYTDDPAGLTGWTFAAIDGVPSDYCDAPGEFQRFARVNKRQEVCEASFFQTDDKVLHMMLRTNSSRLAVSESRDDGLTWTRPQMTSFTDCQCRFHFGRLPDGRFVYVGCPKPESKRTPMVVSLSDDGIVFDKHYIIGNEPHEEGRLRGHQKAGRYGYPTYHFFKNFLYVIYSIEKEDIAMRLPSCARLQDAKYRTVRQRSLFDRQLSN
jgi:hypothetical protein